MNEKLLEAIKELLPEDKVEAISSALNEALGESKKELEGEYNKKLEEAYAEMAKELETSEKTAETGYSEAYTMIDDLRKRLDTQQIEFEKALEEGYEEAYQALVAERGKNENLEVEMYSEYDKKLAEMKGFIVDKVDEFLQFKGKEIYAQARRDVVNDPRMAEHRVTLAKVVDVVSDYISDDDYSVAATGKLEEAQKALEEIEGQKRILEARNIRLSTENNKLDDTVKVLSEQVTSGKEEVISEERKARTDKATKATSRGEKVTEGTRIIGEGEEPEADDESLVENTMSKKELHDLHVLSGLIQD